MKIYKNNIYIFLFLKFIFNINTAKRLKKLKFLEKHRPTITGLNSIAELTYIYLKTTFFY
jgi:hypothetical protein